MIDRFRDLGVGYATAQTLGPTFHPDEDSDRAVAGIFVYFDELTHRQTADLRLSIGERILVERDTNSVDLGLELFLDGELGDVRAGVRVGLKEYVLPGLAHMPLYT